MNCRQTGTLLQAEHDGVLAVAERDKLEMHLTGCAACRAFRTSLAEVAVELRAEAAQVAVPSAAREWEQVRRRLRGGAEEPSRKLAPVYWWGGALATAAAVALAFLVRAPAPSQVEAPAPSAVAAADYVEVGDPAATPVIYVDEQSGWLVVWAVESSGQGNG